MTIKIVLVDDHVRVHQGIAAVMEAFDDLELIGQAANGQEAIDLCDELHPDVVIMDVLMPGMDGIEATRTIREYHPEIKILALSSSHDAAAVRAMLQAGAIGYLLKHSSIDDLAQTIRTVYAGKAVFSAELTSSFMQVQAPVSAGNPKDYGLTPREREILQLMIDGLNNTEIAETLTISISTAKFHVSGVMTKLRVGNRVEAVALAVQEKLLT
jgi:two-component system, NarL family, response regulator LiaR